LLIFPLYPQYSATTTASTFDGVAKTFKHWRHLPEVRMLNEYARDMNYIKALAESIRQHWQMYTQKYLLFSFHGIPQRYIDAGDPYSKLCHVTAKLIADELKLEEKDWSLAFQSRLGPTKWLKPYTDKVLEALPQQNIKDIQVVCPGFPVDCLETLEEIAIRGKEQFFEAGGQSFEYIPALNNSLLHIDTLAEIILKVTNGW
jgi:ferrochelatase